MAKNGEKFHWLIIDGDVSIRLTAKARSLRDIASEKCGESNESCIRTGLHDIGVKLQSRLARRNITLRSLARAKSECEK